MKKVIAPLFIAVSASALGQAPTNLDEQLIWDSLQKLQGENAFELELTGYENFEGKLTRFASNLYFTLSNDPRTNTLSLAKVELDSYVYDPTPKTWNLVRRAVGDGLNLWVYDLTLQRYSSTFYSVYPIGTKRPSTTTPDSSNSSDTPRLLAQLDLSTSGAAAYMVRLIGQGYTNPTYNSWAPGETPMEPLTLPPTQDPLVPTRSYSSSSTEIWVLYGPPPIGFPKFYPVTPNRSVAFQIDNISGNANSPDWRIASVYFAERTAKSFTDWKIQVDDPILTTSLPKWMFQPYAAATIQGWQSLNVSHH